MDADEIVVHTGRRLDQELSLQDYVVWCEDQIQMLRSVVATLLLRQPEAFFGEDLEALAEHGHLPRRNEHTPL